MDCRTEAREDLRNQVGNLRFDLNTLIEGSSKSKADKKSATQLKKDFLIKVCACLTCQDLSAARLYSCCLRLFPGCLKTFAGSVWKSPGHAPRSAFCHLHQCQNPCGTFGAWRQLFCSSFAMSSIKKVSKDQDVHLPCSLHWDAGWLSLMHACRLRRLTISSGRRMSARLQPVCLRPSLHWTLFCLLWSDPTLPSAMSCIALPAT